MRSQWSVDLPREVLTLMPYLSPKAACQPLLISRPDPPPTMMFTSPSRLASSISAAHLALTGSAASACPAIPSPNPAKRIAENPILITRFLLPAPGPAIQVPSCSGRGGGNAMRYAPYSLPVPRLRDEIIRDRAVPG